MVDEEMNRIKTRAHRALERHRLNELKALTAERDALAAQVATMRDQYYELLGVIADVEGRGFGAFDKTCLKTIKRVAGVLADPSPRAADLLAVVKVARPPKTNDSPSPVSTHGYYGGPLCGVKFLYEDGSERFIGHEWYCRLMSALAKLDGGQG